jgi:hypothetical protein
LGGANFGDNMLKECLNKEVETWAIWVKNIALAIMGIAFVIGFTWVMGSASVQQKER